VFGDKWIKSWFKVLNVHYIDVGAFNKGEGCKKFQDCCEVGILNVWLKD